MKKFVTASLMENIAPDPRFKSKLVAKFTNCIMREGKKSIAQRIFYKAMDIAEEKIKGVEPLQVFETAINNVKPVVEVRSKRVGGATYQVPMEVRPVRKLDLGLRWLIANARKRGGKTMYEKLAGELMDAANNTGASVKKRDDTHRMAEANKAFAHYRF